MAGRATPSPAPPRAGPSSHTFAAEETTRNPKWEKILNIMGIEPEKKLEYHEALALFFYEQEGGVGVKRLA